MPGDPLRGAAGGGPPRPDDPGSAHDALAAVLSALSRLLRGEIALARAELTQSLRAARSALAQLLLAFACVLAGIVMLAQAAAAWLVGFDLSPPLAGLAVGVGLFVLAAAFGQAAMTLFGDAGKAPRRSADNIKRDIETLQTTGDAHDR